MTGRTENIAALYRDFNWFIKQYPDLHFWFRVLVVSSSKDHDLFPTAAAIALDRVAVAGNSTLVNNLNSALHGLTVRMAEHNIRIPAIRQLLAEKNQDSGINWYSAMLNGSDDIILAAARLSLDPVQIALAASYSITKDDDFRLELAMYGRLFAKLPTDDEAMRTEARRRLWHHGLPPCLEHVIGPRPVDSDKPVTPFPKKSSAWYSLPWSLPWSWEVTLEKYRAVLATPPPQAPVTLKDLIQRYRDQPFLQFWLRVIAQCDNETTDPVVLPHALAVVQRLRPGLDRVLDFSKARLVEDADAYNFANAEAMACVGVYDYPSLVEAALQYADSHNDDALLKTLAANAVNPVNIAATKLHARLLAIGRADLAPEVVYFIRQWRHLPEHLRQPARARLHALSRATKYDFIVCDLVKRIIDIDFIGSVPDLGKPLPPYVPDEAHRVYVAVLTGAAEPEPEPEPMSIVIPPATFKGDVYIVTDLGHTVLPINGEDGEELIEAGLVIGRRYTFRFPKTILGNGVIWHLTSFTVDVTVYDGNKAVWFAVGVDSSDSTTIKDIVNDNVTIVAKKYHDSAIAK